MVMWLFIVIKIDNSHVCRCVITITDITRTGIQQTIKLGKDLLD